MADSMSAEFMHEIDSTPDGVANPRLSAAMTAIGRLAHPKKRLKYATSSDFGLRSWGKGKDKCNLFAWSCYEFVRPRRGKYGTAIGNGYFTAHESATTTFGGFRRHSMEEEGGPFIGDIIAFPAAGEHAHGHMVINLGQGLVISAGSKAGVTVKSYVFWKQLKGAEGVIQRYYGN
jgi:hypothetical protein